MKIFQKIALIQRLGSFQNIEDISLVSCQELPPTSSVDGVLKSRWLFHRGVRAAYSAIQDRDVGDDVMNKYLSQIDSMWSLLPADVLSCPGHLYQTLSVPSCAKSS